MSIARQALLFILFFGGGGGTVIVGVSTLYDLPEYTRMVAAAWLLLTLACVWFGARHTVALPLDELVKHLAAVRAADDYGRRIDSERGDEIGQLSTEIDRLVAYIEHQQQELTQQSITLEKLSYEDSLTGLANRRAFDEKLQHYLDLSRRENLPLALVMCDVDNFKGYNDYYGHPMGDVALTRVAEALRAVTTRKTDLAARYGGEEFVLLLYNTSADGAKWIASRLVKAVDALQIRHERSAVKNTLSVSAGVAAIRVDQELGGVELLMRADIALYQAKRDGKHRVAIYDDRPQEPPMEGFLG